MISAAVDANDVCHLIEMKMGFIMSLTSNFLIDFLFIG